MRLYTQFVEADVRRALSPGLLIALKLGAAKAQGLVGDDSQISDISAEIWAGEWSFDPERNLATRAAPPATIANLAIWPANAAPTKTGRPPSREWPIYNWAILQRAAAEGRPPKNIAELKEWYREAAGARDLDDKTIREHFIRAFGQDAWDEIKGS